MEGSKNLLGAQRKTWDKATFEQRARDRVERELEEEREKAIAKAPPRVVVQRAPLDRDKARADQNLNLLAEVGKKKVRRTSDERARAAGRDTGGRVVTDLTPLRALLARPRR
jgi:hypothetical protein